MRKIKCVSVSSYEPGLHLCHCVYKSPQAPVLGPAHPEIKPDQALGGWGRGSRLDCGFVVLLTNHGAVRCVTLG